MREEVSSSSPSETKQSGEGEPPSIQRVSSAESDPGPIETAESQFSEGAADESRDSILLVDP